MANRADLLGDLLADLAAEGDALDSAVADLEDVGWLTPTPAEGWTIAHQVAHLAWTDEQALLALTRPERFMALLVDPATSLESLVDEAAAAGVGEDPGMLLARWRAGRMALAAELRDLPTGRRIPWYGPPMSAASMATARLMETWAHGLDVTDALGLPASLSSRLRHVAHLGIRTRDFAFAQHGLPAPGDVIRVELSAPDGSLWSWGPEDADQRVTGPALDFCLRVTRRRHRDDLALQAIGPDADRWLDVAQAFAGPPGKERAAEAGGA